jgi:hypothetical protein
MRIIKVLPISIGMVYGIITGGDFFSPGIIGLYAGIGVMVSLWWFISALERETV